MTDGKMLNELAKEIYEIVKSKGFHGSNTPGYIWGSHDHLVPLKLALLHSEVTGALEAHRKDDHENFSEEMSDIILRALDLCHALGIDIDSAVTAKMIRNKNREYKRGGKRY